MGLSVAELMEQAPMTAHFYFIKAIKYIDAEFGDGYAKKNPALVAAFMRVSALDMQAMLSIED